MRTIWFILLTRVLLCSACHERVVYTTFHSLPLEGWHQDSALTYTAEITDSIAQYDMLIVVRHNEEYPYQNLWLFTRSTAPDSTIAIDTLECFLADNSGKWINQSLLSTHEMPLLYMSNIRFPKIGTYTFDVVHGMRDSVLYGISQIGISIEPIR